MKLITALIIIGASFFGTALLMITIQFIMFVKMKKSEKKQINNIAKGLGYETNKNR